MVPYDHTSIDILTLVVVLPELLGLPSTLDSKPWQWLKSRSLSFKSIALARCCISYYYDQATGHFGVVEYLENSELDMKMQVFSPSCISINYIF